MAKTHYLWDFDNDSYLMEKDGTGATTAVYTNEPVPYGKLISQRRGNTTSYYHYDAEESIRELTDHNQDVTDRHSYTAFGELLSTSGSTVLAFKYRGALGYYTDQETSTIYVRARNYRPDIARWSASDPVATTDGLNLYTFVHNNPINSIDLTGMLTIKPAPGQKLTGSCGQQFEFSWDFQLDTMFKKRKGAPCKGWIVQKVEVTCRTGDCFKSSWVIVPPPDSDYPGGREIRKCCGCNRGDYQFIDYWEAWPVAQGKLLSNLRKSRKVNFTDHAFFTATDFTCGTYLQYGEVRFYCEDPTTGDLDQKWPKGVTHPAANPTHPCNTSSGILRSTEDRPTFWKDDNTGVVDGPKQRIFALNWFCCHCDDPPDFAIAEADPKSK